MNKPFDLRVLGSTVLLTICTSSDRSHVAQLSLALAAVLSRDTEVIVLDLGRIFRRRGDADQFLGMVRSRAGTNTALLVVLGRSGPGGRLLVFAQPRTEATGGREHRLTEMRRLLHVRQLEHRARGMAMAAGQYGPC
ncbi:hypothetical protein ACWGKW_12370 [Streptomyces sp. NPDC054766]|uniref:hypothetical protein n=1 Tax=Streptomyces rhizosphaerihabitans TaxID=1266770 RepID=UPI0021C2542F|nr:hypothetical protein [Streptomyces rhizosphaerihabitans]MCT9009484.1 hypothetical protein [Streptomyces rhizosphaerihabitans]